MADNSGAGADSTFMEGVGATKNSMKRFTTKKNYLDPKFKTAGYVDGDCYPYRGRNMESFCRQALGTLFVPE